MDLHDRTRQHLDRVEHGDRVVGKRRRIDGDAGRGFRRFVQPVDHLVFAVRLAEDQVEPATRGCLSAHRFDIRQSGAPVDLRFALPKVVEIGTVQDVQASGHVRPPIDFPAAPG